MPNLRYLTPFALPLSLLVACGGEGQSTPATKPHAEPAQAPTKTNFTGQTWGFPAQRETVKKMMLKLMDEPHEVPATESKPGGIRGGAGSSDKLSGDQKEEFISSIIKGAEMFLPKSLKDEEKWALVCAEISIESAFQVSTSGVNPGDNSKVSVGPLQLTLPGMWDDIFRQYADLPGLTHYNGTPWDTKKTDNEALKHSIHDGIIAALWCITEQGKRGGPDTFSGPDGPMPKTWKSAELCWVLGAPAARSGADLAGQRTAYETSQKAELQFLGFDPSLFDTPF